MGNITKKDIQSFGKVLQALGELVETEPEFILSLLKNDSEPSKRPQSKSSSEMYSEKIRNLDLYTHAKTHSEEELVGFLKTFSVDELRGIIKKYSIGYTKLKSVDAIADYIADQMKKRTTDVFLQHEK